MDTSNQRENVYLYRVDECDRIVFVCPNWLSFAAENAAIELTEVAVMGQPIWRYIAGTDCREVYQRLFGEIRDRGGNTSFPFRCDSPTLRRFMEMQISQLPNGHLQLEVQLVRDEPQPYCRLLDPDAKRSDRWVTMCAWCKRIKRSQNQWIDLAEAVRALGLFVDSNFPNITHGMCMFCSQTFLADVQVKKDQHLIG